MSEKANNIKKQTDAAAYRRVVIKLGTNLLTGGSKRLDESVIAGLVAQFSALHSQGIELIVVSSGAIAAGRNKLGMDKKRKDIPYKQVLAAVGQGLLMDIYEKLFTEYGITVAQALLTKSDLSRRQGYLNARNTLLTMLEMKIVCIVNENDVVAVDEINSAKFGDNDNLSAMVANLVDADLLLILSDIEGLFTADPNTYPNAKLIPEVKTISEDIEAMVGGSASSLGTGGMITKIQAAKLATASGVTVVIADGRKPGIIRDTVSGGQVGTRFIPSVTKLESRERWMLSGLSVKGKIVVDAGAAIALKKNNRSLLSAGIVDVEGNFEVGDIVNLCDTDGVKIACGMTNYNSQDILAVRGMRSPDIAAKLGHRYGAEVVHRNNLVVL